MAYIQQHGECKRKITVCNEYKTNGQKRMQERTITVPREVSKQGVQQYVMTEAERLEKRFRTGIDQSENTRFEDYANRWLERMAKRYKGQYAGRLPADARGGVPNYWRPAAVQDSANGAGRIV